MWRIFCPESRDKLQGNVQDACYTEFSVALGFKSHCFESMGDTFTFEELTGPAPSHHRQEWFER